jgi:hypothetical protein
MRVPPSRTRQASSGGVYREPRDCSDYRAGLRVPTESTTTCPAARTTTRRTGKPPNSRWPPLPQSCGGCGPTGGSSAGRCGIWPRPASGSSSTSAPAYSRGGPGSGAWVPGGVRGQRPDRAEPRLRAARRRTVRQLPGAAAGTGTGRSGVVPVQEWHPESALDLDSPPTAMSGCAARRPQPPGGTSRPRPPPGRTGRRTGARRRLRRRAARRGCPARRSARTP